MAQYVLASPRPGGLSILALTGAAKELTRCCHHRGLIDGNQEGKLISRMSPRQVQEPKWLPEVGPRPTAPGLDPTGWKMALKKLPLASRTRLRASWRAADGSTSLRGVKSSSKCHLDDHSFFCAKLHAAASRLTKSLPIQHDSMLAA